MAHGVHLNGRKSKSRRFNGFKQHIVAELELELILACQFLTSPALAETGK